MEMTEHRAFGSISNSGKTSGGVSLINSSNRGGQGRSIAARYQRGRSSTIERSNSIFPFLGIPFLIVSLPKTLRKRKWKIPPSKTNLFKDKYFLHSFFRIPQIRLIDNNFTNVGEIKGVRYLIS